MCVCVCVCLQQFSLVLDKMMSLNEAAFTRFATSSSHLRCNGAYKPCVLRNTAKSSFIWFSVHCTKQHSHSNISYQTTFRLDSCPVVPVSISTLSHRVGPHPIPTGCVPIPTFLVPIPIPSSWYKFFVTQSTNHTLVFFSSEKVQWTFFFYITSNSASSQLTVNSPVHGHRLTVQLNEYGS